MALETRIENGRKLAKLTDLAQWNLNARVRKDEDYLSLKKKIARLGLFRDIFINSEGKVIGGNQRLEALIDLNNNPFHWKDKESVPHEIDLRGKFDEVRVTELAFGEKDGKYFPIIDGVAEETLFDTIEQALVEYNVADNAPTAEWDKKALASLIQPHQKLIPMADYKLEVAPPVSLKTFAVKQAQEATKDDEKKSKKVVLKAEFTPDQYTKFEPSLQKVLTAYKAENMTDLLVTLVEEAEVFINDKEKQAQEQAA